MTTTGSLRSEDDNLETAGETAATTATTAVIPKEIESSIEHALQESAQDMGHRIGNFHNYYSFHPPSIRLQHMGAILDYVRDTSSRKRKRGEREERTSPEPFRYCDLGCNEGDLTIEIATALQGALQQPVEFKGMDIDAQLIQRANAKWKNTDNLSGTFESANICTDLDAKIEDRSMDLISLLSTTMWVHVHAGDEGLKSVLEQLCRKSRRYLVIEPQPSKCYRNAMIRLRKMGRPELDVSSDRLKWRLTLDDEIEKTLNNCLFQRVLTDKELTSWNRSIHLYEKRDG
ncbi:Bicoid-interacting protein 3 (Bin3) [Fragilaria crotonensis]|nr:Bicoid-interacting protein 3 (Bin3) [Fragilaria crotonensis]